MPSIIFVLGCSWIRDTVCQRIETQRIILLSTLASKTVSQEIPADGSYCVPEYGKNHSAEVLWNPDPPMSQCVVGRRAAPARPHELYR